MIFVFFPVVVVLVVVTAVVVVAVAVHREKSLAQVGTTFLGLVGSLEADFF